MRTIRSKKKKDPAVPEPSMLDKFNELISGIMGMFTNHSKQTNELIASLKEEMARNAALTEAHNKLLMALTESLNGEKERPIVVNNPEKELIAGWEVSGFERDYLGHAEKFTLTKIKQLDS